MKRIVLVVVLGLLMAAPAFSDSYEEGPPPSVASPDQWHSGDGDGSSSGEQLVRWGWGNMDLLWFLRGKGGL